MSSSNFETDAPDKIYRWIEKKSVTEAVAWTIREKFYLISSVMQYGTDWKSIVQIVKNAGEPYRPIEWYTTTNCERQLKFILNNQTNEVKSMDDSETLRHIYDVLLEEFVRDLKKADDNYITKYSTLNNTMTRIKQGNMSRNEINNLYSQARRNEVEGKQYVEQLRTRQNVNLASENSSSGSLEEPIKWNAPSAPLLTSLLRSRNTIPTHRNSTAISSQLQSPSGTSRTRSGKLLPLSPSPVRTTQGTPTLSKLLEAPANPYIPSPPHSVHKNKQNEVTGMDRLNGNNSKKENSQSPVLNRARVDNLITHGPFNQLNKCDLSYSKRQTSRSPVSTAKNGSKTNTSVVNLLSDSENEDDNKNTTLNIYSKNVFQIGEKKDVAVSPSRIEPRATRSQTRAEGSFKLLNDNKLSGGKKEQEALQQQSEESQMTKSNLVDDDVIDVDHIVVEPLSAVQDEIIISSKVTRSSLQKIGVKNPAENLLTNKTNSKEINNQMLEEISANFVLNSSTINEVTDNKNTMVGHSQIDNTNITGSLVPVDSSVVKNTIMLRRDAQCLPSTYNTSTSFDGKLKQKRIIELKGTNIRCIDTLNDKTIMSFTSRPVVVVNKLKKPFNIKLATEIKDKTEDIQVVNYDTKKVVRLQSSPQNLVQLVDGQCSFSDEIIIIDDDVNVSVDDGHKESSKSESQVMSLKAIVDNDKSNMLSNSKTTNSQLDKTINNIPLRNSSVKFQNLVDMPTKKIVNQVTLSKSESENNTRVTNNHRIKKLDYDCDQSTSSLSEFYNGVEEIVEMHSLNNELNTLIECGSGTSTVEKRQNTVILDKSKSSVKECDSIISAFDTTTQITRAVQKAVSSKDNKSVVREIKISKQDKNDFERFKGIIRTENNDEHNSGASVTGIPILQGVITDAMSKINSVRVIDLNKPVGTKSVLINEIVEISSDEEENDFNNVKVADKNRIQDQELNIKKLNQDKSQTTKNLEKGIKGVGCETNIFIATSITNTISNEIIRSNKTNVKNNTYDIAMKCVTKETENKHLDEEVCEENHKRTEMNLLPNIGTINKRKDSIELRSKTDIKSQIDNNKIKLIELVKNAKETDKYLSICMEEKEGQAHVGKIKNMEVKVAEETKTNKFEGGIVQSSKQNEDKKSFEIILLKDTKMKNVKEDKTNKINIDEKCKKSIEVTIINEIENKSVDVQREAEIPRSKDDAVFQMAKKAEINQAKEVEKKKTKECGIPKSKTTADIQGEVEAKRLKDIGLTNIMDTKIQKVNDKCVKDNDETKLIKKDEAKKANKVEEKKVTNMEMYKKVIETKETKFVELEDTKVIDVEHKAKGLLLKKDSDLEIIYTNEKIDTNILDQRVLTSGEESKKTKKLERSLVDSKKVGENSKEYELKISLVKEPRRPNIAENEVKQNKKAQIITRTRGLKVEEKLKESMSIKDSLVILKPFVPSSSVVCSTDCIRSLNNENKYYSSSNLKLVNSKAFDRDSSINSNESANEVIVDQNEPSTIPKASVGIKTRISASLDHESPITNSNSQRKISLSQTDSSSKLLYENRGKKLTTVEKLSADEVPFAEDNILKKQSEINAIIDKHLSQKIIEISDNLCLKKRGRKRRNDTQNDELHQSDGEKSTKFGATAAINTMSTNAIEPPTKRTRRNTESLIDNNISWDKTKQKLKTIYENVCENNKLLLIINEQIIEKSEYWAVIKDPDYPVYLGDIKSKIDCGQVSEISDLQVNILRMSVNLNMISDTNDTLVADEASNAFIHELAYNKEFFQCSDDEGNDVGDEFLSDSDDKLVKVSNNKCGASDVNNYKATLSDCTYNDDFDPKSLLLNFKKMEDDSDNSCDYDDDSDQYNLDIFL